MVREIGIEKERKETFKSLCDLLKWTETFKNTNMKEIAEILEPHKEKVVFIKKKQEIDRILTD